MDWMPSLTIMESLAGPVIHSQHEGAAATDELWANRVKVVTELVQDLESRGRAGDYETLLWRDALAFWALRIGDHAAAQRFLDANDAYYESILAPADRWRDLRRGMHLTAAVLRAADRPPGAPLDADARRAVESAARDLLALADQLEGDAHNRALRLLFLMAARRAYEPDMLADADQADELRRRLVRREEVPESAVSLPAPTR